MHFTQICRFPHRLLSTVHRGTAFEYRALALLTKHMSMSLTRVGGSHDGGIDLVGWWWVPREKTYPLDATTSEPPRTSNAANRRRLRVLAQCKAEKRKMGPAYLRELEGVVYRHAALAAAAAAATPAPDSSPPLLLRPRLPRDLDSTSDPLPRPLTAPAASVPTFPATDTNLTTTATVTTPTPTAMEHPPVVAILVSQSAFTRNCLLAAHASPLPFLLVHLPPTSSSSSSNRISSDAGSAALGAVFGNPALVSARGVLRGELEIRWERGTGTGTGTGAGAGAQSGGTLDAPSGAARGGRGGGGGSGGGGGGRPGLWWQGQPLPSWTPDAEVADGALLEQR